MEAIDWIYENWIVITVVITALVTAFVTIAKMTPNKEDDKWAAKISGAWYGFLKFITEFAKNIGRPLPEEKKEEKKQ